MGILSGIRVVDFTRVVAGPYCTMLLGDLGAEVIKLEQPEHGDDTRGWPPFVEGESSYFLAINRNKKSVCLDMHNEQDRETVRKLILSSDVVIENFRTGVMERFGLGYEDLRANHARLIYCSISGYGHTGPYKDRAGYDVIVAALGGLMSVTGTPGGPPVKPGVALTDIITGLNAYSAILAAFYHRERTGLGQRIDVSLLSAQLAALINAASSYLIAGEVMGQQGSAHVSVVPYQAFPAKDGYVMLGAANDKLFRLLADALGHAEWAIDERFATNAARVKHREQLLPMMEEVLLSDTVDNWVQLLADIGVAVAPVNTMDKVFNDPQVIHTQQVVPVEHTTVGAIKLVGPAVSYSLAPNEVMAPPPLLGEHTEEIRAIFS